MHLSQPSLPAGGAVRSSWQSVVFVASIVGRKLTAAPAGLARHLVIPRICGRSCARRSGDFACTGDKRRMSCGWLKNLEVIPEKACATYSAGRRNHSLLKTGSAPGATSGTPGGSRRPAFTGLALDSADSRRYGARGVAEQSVRQSVAEQSACEGCERTSRRTRRPGNRLTRAARRLS